MLSISSTPCMLRFIRALCDHNGYVVPISVTEANVLIERFLQCSVDPLHKSNGRSLKNPSRGGGGWRRPAGNNALLGVVTGRPIPPLAEEEGPISKHINTLERTKIWSCVQTGP
jgi:hypothetical protein